MAWVIKDSYPYQDTLDKPIEVLIEPAPHTVMTLAENEYPSYSFLEPLEVPENPVPYSLMVQKKGEYPKYSYLNLIDIGAFANTVNLRYIRIPETVKRIGEYAFRNTALTSVTIARDCEYYPTSFPDGCVINFY